MTSSIQHQASPPHPLLGAGIMILGLLAVAATLWGTSDYAFPFYAHAYPFAWYGLILFLDGLLYRRWSDGLILRKPREFALLLFWSAMFWFVFELWNLRLQNWYFVGVPPEGLWPHVEVYLDFATVLPGMFLVYRLLCRLGVPGVVRTGFCLGPWALKGSVVTGCVMFVLPLAWPDYFFPMVWGAPAFLLDPVCAKHRARSLLEDGRHGEWTTFVRLLLAGMLCGGYWELCNFWSLEKWIYTVPFFSQGKFFEMPYLGFLGFAPFCVTCFVMTNALYLLRGGRHWDPEQRLTAGETMQPATERVSKGPASSQKIPLPLEGVSESKENVIPAKAGIQMKSQINLDKPWFPASAGTVPGSRLASRYARLGRDDARAKGGCVRGAKRGHRVLYTILAIAAVFLSEWTYERMKIHTIDSHAETLEATLKDIKPGLGRKLRGAGFRYPGQVLAGWETVEPLLEISLRDRVRRRLELATLLHLGGTNARLLEMAGIDSRKELARQDPDLLFHRIQSANHTFRLRAHPLVKRRVTAWINGAKRRSFVY